MEKRVRGKISKRSQKNTTKSDDLGSRLPDNSSKVKVVHRQHPENKRAAYILLHGKFFVQQSESKDRNYHENIQKLAFKMQHYRIESKTAALKFLGDCLD